jgi:hypothetical protein
MFEYPVVRVLAMLIASGIASGALLLLSIDLLGSGEMVFEGILPYLMLASIGFPIIATCYLGSSAAEGFICGILGYGLGVVFLSLSLYGYSGMKTDFVLLFRDSWYFAHAMTFSVGILVVLANLVGYTIKRVADWFEIRRLYRE